MPDDKNKNNFVDEHRKKISYTELKNNYSINHSGTKFRPYLYGLTVYEHKKVQNLGRQIHDPIFAKCPKVWIGSSKNTLYHELVKRGFNPTRYEGDAPNGYRFYVVKIRDLKTGQEKVKFEVV